MLSKKHQCFLSRHFSLLLFGSKQEQQQQTISPDNSALKIIDCI